MPSEDDARRARAARNARASRARARAGEHSPRERVDTAAVREVLLQAAREGLHVTLIAALSGVSETRVSRIRMGRQTRCEAATERALLAGVEHARRVAARGRVSPARVLAGPSRDLMRRLGAAGWPMSELLAARGIPDNVLRDRALYITPETDRAIRALYAEVGEDGRMGPSVQSARTWQARGYLVPAAESPEDMIPMPSAADRARARAERDNRARRERHARMRAKRNSAGSGELPDIAV